MGWVDDVIGGSALLWRHQHNVAHHAHPNDKDLDPGASAWEWPMWSHNHHHPCPRLPHLPDSYGTYPLTRFNPEFKRLWFHAFQWLYAPALLYPLIGIKYTLGDIVSVARAAYAHVPLHGLRTIDWLLFLSGKAVHYGLLLVLPIRERGYKRGLAALLTPPLPRSRPQSSGVRRARGRASCPSSSSAASSSRRSSP